MVELYNTIGNIGLIVVVLVAFKSGFNYWNKKFNRPKLVENWNGALNE